MQSTVDIDRLRELLGVMVFDSAHEPVGTVKEVFYDDATTVPSWLGVAVASEVGACEISPKRIPRAVPSLGRAFRICR